MGTLVAVPLTKKGVAITEVGEVNTLKTEYYLVRAISAAEILQELNTIGPGDGSGQRFDALTTWKIKSDPKNGEKRCHSTILLPKALNYTSFSKPLKDAWDVFTDRLEEHEKKHADLISLTFITNKDQPLSVIASAITVANSELDDRTNHERDIRAILKNAE